MDVAMSMSGLVDRDDLIRAARTGDPAAVERLLAVCEVEARRYARKFCRTSDIDDAVQESLLIVSRKVGGLQAVAAFSAWLFTVIRRECRRLERMMFGADTLEEDEVERHLLGKTDNDLRIDLAAALKSLPAHYLEVVLLSDFEELTIAEIAARLGERAGAVKSRLHRAREMVRSYMMAPLPTDGPGLAS